MKTPLALATAALLSTSLLMGSSLVQADNLVIPLGQQATQSSASLPQRGMTTSRVSQLYGEPSTRHPAVGQPPISRWDYSDFSVYFEYDKVIHSVRQHRRTGN